MSGGIFLIQADGKLLEMRQEPYKSEDIFQRFLADYPSILAGDQIDAEAPRRWLFVAREVAVPGELDGSGKWSLDHLFVDQDGIPTFVEVKRSTDTRIRREVVGQMLDYAANGAAYWPTGTIRAQFERTCESKALNPEQVLAEFLGSIPDVSGFWQRVEANLREGRLRLLFVADEIPIELRSIVEFLNKQMDRVEVLAVELRQYVSEGLKTLVPRVFGQTAEAEQRKNASPRGEAWTEDRFFDALRQRGEPDVRVGQRIFNWCKDKGANIWWGRGLRYGSFVPEFDTRSNTYQPFAVWTSGQINIYFQYFQKKPPFDSQEKRTELLSMINASLSKRLSLDAIERQPGIAMRDLAREGMIDAFLKAFDWFLAEIKSANMLS